MGLMSLFIVSAAPTGSFAGAYLLRFVPENALKKGFAAFLVEMAAFIFYQNPGDRHLPSARSARFVQSKKSQSG